MAEMENESPAVEKAEDEPTIDNLAKLSDQELAQVLGLDVQLKEARKALKDMQALTGKAREYAEDRVTKMLTPHVYPSEFKYIAEDAQRKTKSQTGKQAQCDCDPCSVL